MLFDYRINTDCVDCTIASTKQTEVLNRIKRYWSINEWLACYLSGWMAELLLHVQSLKRLISMFQTNQNNQFSSNDNDN